MNNINATQESVVIDFGTIYNVDALNIVRDIPDNYFDLTLTDPPYGIGKLTGTISKERNRNDYDTFSDTEEYYKTIVCPIIVESIRASKRTILTPGIRNFNYLPQPDDFGVFYQPATAGISRWGRPDAQPIFYYGKGVHRNITQFNSRQLTEPASYKDGHPCSKPIQAWKWLLNKGSIEGDRVFDPFMGSGTTAVACIQLNRLWAGAEISQKYCDVAIKRILIEQNQLKLF